MTINLAAELKALADELEDVREDVLRQLRGMEVRIDELTDQEEAAMPPAAMPAEPAPTPPMADAAALDRWLAATRGWATPKRGPEAGGWSRMNTTGPPRGGGRQAWT